METDGALAQVVPSRDQPGGELGAPVRPAILVQDFEYRQPLLLDLVAHARQFYQNPATRTSSIRQFFLILGCPRTNSSSRAARDTPRSRDGGIR